MTLVNGRLPASTLAPIYGADGTVIVGHLRKDAAAAWNAMCERARELGLPVPIPDGPVSSYRTYEQQVALRAQWCAKGACQNAAVPGTSNHGWGLAVDSAPNTFQHGEVVYKIGAPYGYSHAWSDAPWEPWHHKFNDHVRVPLWKPNYRPGSWGPNVFLLTGRLQHLGYLKRRFWRYGSDVTQAIKAFQRKNHLRVDGIAGPMTWYAIKRQAIHKPHLRRK